MYLLEEFSLLGYSVVQSVEFQRSTWRYIQGGRILYSNRF
jgi:hypothetical protein